MQRKRIELPLGRLLPVSLVSLACVLASTPQFTCGQEASGDRSATTTSDPQSGGGSNDPPALVQLYTDAANFQNNQAFELAVEAWQKFLTNYPDDRRVPEVRYNLGISQLQLASKPSDTSAEQFDQAVKTLTQVAEGDQKSLAADAWLNLGLAQYTWALKQTDPAANQKHLQQSAAALTRYLDQYPDATRKDQALFYRGEAQYMQQETAGALASYQRLIDEFPGSPLFPDALYALGVACEESRDFVRAEQAFQTFLEKVSEHGLLTEVTMRRAESQLQQKKYAEAAEGFEKSAATAGFSQADHALFRAAYCWASLDNYRKAADTFIAIVEKFPQSPLVAEATIAAGRSLYRIPDLEAARTWYAQAAQLDGTPQAVVLANEASHWLNRDALQAGQLDKVLQVVEKRLPLAKPTDYLVHFRMDRADAWYQQPAQKSAALAQYEAIAKEFPDHYLAPRALYNAAYAYLEQGQFDKAREIANTPFAQSSDQAAAPLIAELRSVSAEAALQTKQYEPARDLFAELREKGPEAYRAYWGVRQALAMHLAGQHAEAIQVLDVVTPLLTTAPHRAEAAYVRGLCLMASNDAAGAEKSLQESLTLDRKWKQADETLFALARVQRQSQGPEVALQTIAQIPQEFPQCAVMDEVTLRWAEFAYAAKQYPLAATRYQELLTKWPESEWQPFAYYGLGWALVGQENQAAARDAFSQCLDKFPTHRLAPRARYSRGVTLHRLGEFAAARTDLDQYAEENPTDEQTPEAIYLSAACSTALKQPEQATRRLKTLVEKHPAFRRADRVAYDLAWAHKEAGQNDEAYQQFQVLVEKYPQSPLTAEGLYHLAERDYEAGKYSEAQQRYVAVTSHPSLTDNPELAEKAAYKLAWCHYQGTRYAEALEGFTAQVAKFPKGALLQDAQFMIGECHFQQRTYDKALETYRSLVVEEVRPDVRPLLYLHGGQSAAQQKRWEESLKWLQVVAERYADSEYIHQANYEMGWAYHQTGRRDEAIQSYQKVADGAKNAVGARARFMIGELLFEQKKYSQAVQEFQRVMYGYGGTEAPEPLHVWQAKSGFEAGQCATAIARTARDAATRQRWTAEANKAFQYVVKSHPNSEEAKRAKERLQQLGT